GLRAGAGEGGGGAGRRPGGPARPPAGGASPAVPSGGKPGVKTAPPARPAPCTPVGAATLGESVTAEKILKDLHDGKTVTLKSVVIEGNLDADLEWPAPSDDRRSALRVVPGLVRLESCRIAGRVAFRRAVFLQGLELPCSEVRGDLDLADADLPALLAPRVHVVGPVRLGGLSTGSDVDLTGAQLDDRLEAGGRIRGDLRLSNAELRGGGEFS